MSKANHQFAKRQKELEKKRKQEEKRQRKQNKNTIESVVPEGQYQDEET